MLLLTSLLLAAESLSIPSPVSVVGFMAPAMAADGIAHSAWVSRPAAIFLPPRVAAAPRISVAASSSLAKPPAFAPILAPEYPADLLKDIMPPSSAVRLDGREKSSLQSILLKADAEAAKKTPPTPKSKPKRKEKNLGDKIKEVWEKGLDDLADALFPRQQPGLQPIPIPIPVHDPQQFPRPVNGGVGQRWKRRRR